MNQFFKALNQGNKGSQRSLDQSNRVVYPILGIVCETNADRRIKITDPANPKLASDWLKRLPILPGIDPPMPKIGSSVLCYFVDGLFSQGWYASVENDTNPPQEKEDPFLDHYQTIPGNFVTQIDKQGFHRYEKQVYISGGENVFIRNDMGASVELLKEGATKFSDAFGNYILVGGLSAGLPGAVSDIEINFSSGGTVRFNLGGGSLNIVNAADVKINGASVTVVGHLDDDGDIATTRGY